MRAVSRLNRENESIAIRFAILFSDQSMPEAAAECAELPVTLKTFPTATAMDSKLEILNSLGADNCCTIGNGRNDLLMCRESALSISVIGEEGCYSKLITQTNITVKNIEDGFELLLKPKRLIATLRG